MVAVHHRASPELLSLVPTSVDDALSTRAGAAAYWRRRAIAFVLAVALVVGVGAGAMGIGRTLVGGGGDRSLAAAAAGAAPGAPLAPSPPAGEVHVVGPGETLWSIARSVHTGGDIRATVDRLAEENGGAHLRVGQEIVLD